MSREYSTPIPSMEGGKIPNISLNEVNELCLTGGQTFLGLQTLRASTDSLRRSQAVSELSPMGEEKLRASARSFRTPAVYTNHAYDNYLACDDYLPENQYEDLQSVKAKQNAPRRKTNEMYESTTRSPPAIRRRENELYERTDPPARGPRKRQITECSNDSIGSYRSDIGSTPRQSCLTNMVLFLVLAFSMAAFVLVILLMFGKVGMQCGCKGNQAVPRPRAEKQVDPSGQPSIYMELERKFNTLQQRMEARNEEYKQLQNRVRTLETLMNKSADEPANVLDSDNVKAQNLTRPEDELVRKLNSQLRVLEQKLKKTQNQLATQSNETSNAFHQIQEHKIQLNSQLSDLEKILNYTRNQLATQRNKTSSALDKILLVERRLHNESSSASNLQTNISQRIRAVDEWMGKLSQNISSLQDGVDKLNRTRMVPGQAVDFSSCEPHIEESSPQTGEGTKDVFYKETPVKKVTGATCSSDLGMYTSLTYTKIGNTQLNRYKCSCEKKRDGTTKTWKCKIVIWYCKTS